NVHREALPILCRWHFGATVFLVTGHVGGHNDWETPPNGVDRRPLVTWQEAAEFADAGIEIGAHTRRHPDLRQLSADDAKDEIQSSKREIESRLNQPVVSFAYPYGSVSAVAKDVVSREFSSACTTVLGRASRDTAHALPRVDMYYFRAVRDLRGLLEGTCDGYLGIRRWGRAVRGA